MRALAAVATFVAVAVAVPPAVAASASAPPADTAAEVVDVAAAREGLAAWLAANKPASPSTSTDLPGCPAVDLAALEGAMADIGLDGSLGDWGTEIEWDEYQDIDRNLMGIVCGGDTDGDAHDTDYELAAGVFAVDAGTDERAISVIEGLGFGALDVVDADIAGVPGGELTTGCVGDGGLATCLTFWNLDGLVIGTTLWSDSQSLPEGASQSLLEALLPTMLTTLAGQAGAAPAATAASAAPAGDGTAVGDAGAGLARILGGSADTPADAPLERCVLADDATVDAALATSGSDTPLAGWGQWIGPITPTAQWPQRAIVCGGQYVGTGEADFPETSLNLAVVDFGDADTLASYAAEYLGVAADEEPLPAATAGGTTTGRCAQRDRAYDCYEVWSDGGGLAVMVHVTDRTYFDRPSASAVLDALVPAVLAALGGRASEVGDELAGIAAGQIDGAEAGLAEFAGAAPARTGLDCPAATTGEVDEALAAAGVDAELDGWSARLDSLESTNGAEPATRLACTDADSLVTLDVISFADPVDADEFVASVGLADGGSPDDLEPGAVVIGSCTTVSAQEYCNAWWHDGTLVIGVTLFADADEITRNDAGEVLTALVPGALSALEALAG